MAKKPLSALDSASLRGKKPTKPLRRSPAGWGETVTETFDGDVSKPRFLDLNLGWGKPDGTISVNATDNREIWPRNRSLTELSCIIFDEWDSGKHGPKTTISQREVFRRGIERYQFPGRKRPTAKRLQDLHSQCQYK
jgi:hypothetical protein